MREFIAAREFDTILDSIDDGIIAVDAEGVVSLFNRTAERITGLKSEEVKGKPAVEVIPNTRLHIVLKTGEPELNQQQVLSGTTAIVTNRTPLRDEHGRITGALAVFRDVTEIESLSERVCDLWDARTLLEAVIHSTEDAISVADENGNNIIVNPAYSRITGLSREQVIGKSATVDIAEGESMHMKVLGTGKPVRNVRMKVGPRKRDVVVNVAPIVVDGDIKGSVGVIHDISEIRSLTEELSKTKKLLRQLKARYTMDDIIGVSPAMFYAKEEAKRVASTPATVLLLGESGVGKELFAHAIHNASHRRGGQFVSINCATIVDSLLESELFGYVEGAFTGAKKGGHRGLFEEAEGGTMFLDEVSELGTSLQSKLLRVLQEKEVLPVGGTKSVSVDVRVIAATNSDLNREVSKGTFREDLFYRLNMVPIRIAALRERREDIPVLVEHLLSRLNEEYDRQVREVSDEALEYLAAHDWPGNVRELENVLGRALISMRPQDTAMMRCHLPPLRQEPLRAPLEMEPASVRPLEDIVSDAEKMALESALAGTGGNRTKAARLLKISIRSLYYKMRKFGIE
jgi:PAS domain S-box-containing protein